MYLRCKIAEPLFHSFKIPDQSGICRIGSSRSTPMGGVLHCKLQATCYWTTMKRPEWCIECIQALRYTSDGNLVLSSKQMILAMCLRHRIPAMVDHSAGDLPIFESGAIMWYLGKQHDPHGKLFPKASICNTRASCSGLGSFRQRPALTPPLRILTLPRCKGLGCSRLHNAQMAS